jgi:hypothetical protein
MAKNQNLDVFVSIGPSGHDELEYRCWSIIDLIPTVRASRAAARLQVRPRVPTAPVAGFELHRKPLPTHHPKIP